MHPLEVGEGREASSAGIENRNGHFEQCINLAEPANYCRTGATKRPLRLFGGH